MTIRRRARHGRKLGAPPTSARGPRADGDQDSPVRALEPHVLFEANPYPMWIFDQESLAFLAVNDAAVSVYGYSRAEFLAMSIRNIRPPEDVVRLLAVTAEPLAGYGDAGVWRHQKKDGSIIDVRITSHSLTFAGRNAELVLSLPLAFQGETTTRRLADARILRLNRIYALLSSVSQATVRLRDLDAFFADVCRIAVEDAPFLSAWLGLLDPASGDLRVVARGGGDDAFLAGLPAVIQRDQLGTLPPGRALRAGRAVVCNDIARGDRMATWKNAASASGCRSAASFPILVAGEAIGVFNVRTGEVGFFGAEETRLLDELASNISVAVQLHRSETRRRAAEHALRVSEERLRSALHATNQGLYDLNVQTGVAVVNDAYGGMLGYDPATFTETNAAWLERLHPDDRELIETTYRAYVAGAIPEYRVEFRQRTASGGWKWVLSQGRIVERDAAGAPLRMLGTHTDITERKQSEAERSRLLDILERSLNEIYLFDAETLRFCYVNAGALRNLGYAREALAAMTPLDIKPDFTESSFREMLAPLRDGREEKRVFETDHRRADGSRYPVEVHLQLVEHARERFFLAVIIDISERRRADAERGRLQAQLLHAQKMEAVGTLAGGIAHDFNNVLTAVSGYANLLLAEPPEEPLNRSFVHEILSAAQWATSLTQRLLAFSRKQVISPRPVNVNALIEHVGKMLTHLIGEDIRLRTALTLANTTVMADAGQIEQMLLNLATNARDAMPHGGDLVIETSVDGPGAEAGVEELGPHVLIAVTDGGEGMEEHVRQRVFEPFFTTKGAGKGTGLGLSITYAIVKQHRGTIRVESEKGRGARFEIRLPLHDVVSVPAAAPTPSPAPRGGSETVLLAEDDPAIRRLTRRVLESAGYHVIEAVDGEDALRKFGEHREAVDLIVCDVIMPRKNGRQVYDEARRAKPRVKVLFTSGYPADILEDKGLFGDAAVYVAKPVSPQELLARVRVALDAA